MRITVVQFHRPGIKLLSIQWAELLSAFTAQKRSSFICVLRSIGAQTCYDHSAHPAPLAAALFPVMPEGGI